MVTVAWDVDDVLNELMRFWFEKKWITEHPKVRLKYVEITENPPHKLLGVSKEEYLTSLDEFRLSIKYKKMQPVPEVKNWFVHYGKFFRHIALTAAPLSCTPISAAWVIRHFGYWVRSFSFVPSQRKRENLPQYDKTKGDLLRWWGKADILVDDSISNVEEAQSMGMQAILMPQPWNNSKLTTEQTLELLMNLTRKMSPHD
jgi:hypothetical protein